MPPARHPLVFRLCAAVLVLLAGSPYTFPFGTCDLIAPVHDAGATTASSAKAKLHDDATAGGAIGFARVLGFQNVPTVSWRPGPIRHASPTPRLLALRL